MHQTAYLPSISADVDLEIVDLVLAINELGARTTSSCQGNPGRVDQEQGGRYGVVVFEKGNGWQPLCEFVFAHLRRKLEGMDDDVTLEVTCWDQKTFYGWLYFRNEAIGEVTRRLKVP